MSLIVVVDDRATNRNIICRLARTLDAGVEAVAFDRPQPALEFMAKRQPDLVITDFSMPEMDGAEFVRRCRTEIGDGNVPVIVVTAYEDRDFRYRALEAGATDFLLSPIDHREFRTRATNLLTIGLQQRIIRQRAQHLEVERDEALRQSAETLRRSEEKLRRVIDTVPALISASDAAGRCTLVNRYHATLTDATGDTIEALFGAAYWQRHAPLNHKVLVSGGALPSFEEELRDGAGRSRVFLTTKAPLTSAGTEIDSVLTVSIDITDRKEYERRLLHQANYDDITNLPNRLLALDRLLQAIARARRNGTQVAVLYVDLDEFKKVNDTVGHAVGDRLLVEAAERLTGSVRGSDTVGRLGGDEFLVVLPDVEREGRPDLVVRKILDELGRPFLVGGHEFYIGASIGVTLFPQDGAAPEELLQNADAAMYRAKAAGRNTFCFFSPEISAAARRRVEMEALLRHAAERHELHLVYQPIAELAGGRIMGVEALLRWESAQLGPVMPDRFIPLAEETGLIVGIGAWVLETACRQAMEWRRRLGLNLRIGVNVSYRQFLGHDFPATVARALEQTGLPPDSLELEITERLLMHDVHHAHDVLLRLRQMGVRLAIDDFGTGYASIIYLKRFPFSTLKIDKEFVADVGDGQDGAALVTAMINMAHGLKLEIVGEGVETEGQLEFLRSRGCHNAQGWHLSKPKPPAELEKVLAAAPNDALPRGVV